MDLQAKVAKILVVDDDISFGELTQRRLARMNYEVKLHPGPNGAMAELHNGNFDLALIDVNMPGLRGPDVVRMIRMSAHRVRVLLYSSMDPKDLRQLAESSEADGYLSKSAPTKELEFRVRQTLGSAGERLRSARPDDGDLE